MVRQMIGAAEHDRQPITPRIFSKVFVRNGRVLVQAIFGSESLKGLCDPSSEQVKWLLKQMLAGGRPDITDVARELGLSVRTLQRRIVEKGRKFRDLLLAVRQELVRTYFAQPEIQVNEVAFQLGYEDTNSFDRAFRNWEGTTPSQWRTDWKETNRDSSFS